MLLVRLWVNSSLLVGKFWRESKVIWGFSTATGDGALCYWRINCILYAIYNIYIFYTHVHATCARAHTHTHLVLRWGLFKGSHDYCYYYDYIIIRKMGKLSQTNISYLFQLTSPNSCQGDNAVWVPGGWPRPPCCHLGWTPSPSPSLLSRFKGCASWAPKCWDWAWKSPKASPTQPGSCQPLRSRPCQARREPSRTHLHTQ